jgi:CRP-like cAMP-binding protein
MLPRPAREVPARRVVDAMDQKHEMLSKVPLFAGLGPRDLAKVGRLEDEVKVKAGKVLAREGAAAEEFFIILEGTVRISRGGRTLRDLGPGEFFGELAMLGKVPRTATATALTSAHLLVVGHREFITLLAEYPTIQAKIIRSIAAWIATLSPDRLN